MIGIPYTIIMPSFLELVPALEKIHPAVSAFVCIVLVIVSIFTIKIFFKNGD